MNFQKQLKEVLKGIEKGESFKVKEALNSVIAAKSRLEVRKATPHILSHVLNKRG